MATTAFLLKRDSTANWNANNPVLLDGEPGVEETPSGRRLQKIGDGATTWTALDYTGARKPLATFEYNDISYFSEGVNSSGQFALTDIVAGQSLLTSASGSKILGLTPGTNFTGRWNYRYLTAAANLAANDGDYILVNTAAAQTIVLPTPVPGAEIVIICSCTQTVIGTGGANTIVNSNNTASTNALNLFYGNRVHLIADSGSWRIIGGWGPAVTGIDRGNTPFPGNGSTTSAAITIPHNLGVTPTSILLAPITASAGGETPWIGTSYSYSVGAQTFQVVCLTSNTGNFVSGSTYGIAWTAIA